ncbi:MAG: class I SAM-dependent methyltransferase [Clostridia bacterium]|nr:class I SAM-dependent methyltransferase [Clostridia bacterium]
MQYGAFAEYYDIMMHDVDYDGWADYISSLIEQYGGGKRLLDCACGSGSLTIRLCERGYELTGSDLSPEMLFEAQKKAKSRGLNIPFVRQDLKNISLHRPVDVINCSCDGVNYLLSLDEVAAFFKSAWRNLKEGGLLLFDCSTEYKLAEVLGNRFIGEDKKDYAYLWTNSYDARSRLILMELSFFVKEGELYRRFREKHLQRAHRREEIEELLIQCGFEHTASFEAFTREEPQKNGQRIQYVARRR